MPSAEITKSARRLHRLVRAKLGKRQDKGFKGEQDRSVERHIGLLPVSWTPR